MDAAEKKNVKQIVIVEDEEDEMIVMGEKSVRVAKKQIVLSEAETESDGNETATDDEEENVFVSKPVADENKPPKTVQSINVDNEVFAGPVSMAERIVSRRIGGRRRPTLQEVEEEADERVQERTEEQNEEDISDSADATQEDHQSAVELTATRTDHVQAADDCQLSTGVEHESEITTAVVEEVSDCECTLSTKETEKPSEETDCEDNLYEESASNHSTESCELSSATDSDHSTVVETSTVEASEQPLPESAEVDESVIDSATIEAEVAPVENSVAQEDTHDTEVTVNVDDTQATVEGDTCKTLLIESVESEDTSETDEDTATSQTTESINAPVGVDIAENIDDSESVNVTESAEYVESVDSADSGDQCDQEMEASCEPQVEDDCDSNAFRDASHALSENFDDVIAVYTRRQQFRTELEEVKANISLAVESMLEKRKEHEQEEEEARAMRQEAERISQRMVASFIEKFEREEKKRFAKESEEKISSILRRKMAAIELNKARENTLNSFVRSLVSKTRESLAEMKKEAREAAIKEHLEVHHKRQQEMYDMYLTNVTTLQNGVRSYLARKTLSELKRQKVEAQMKEEERKRILTVMSEAVENIVERQRELERQALRERQEEVMQRMVESFKERVANQKAQEEAERKKRKDEEAAKKRRASVDAAKARVLALQQQRREERERKQRQLDEELQNFAEKGGSTLRAASASYVALAAPIQSPVLPSAPSAATTSGVACAGAQTVSVPVDSSTAGLTLREQTNQKLELLREQRRQRMEAALRQSGSATTTTTDKLKEITDHWSKKVDSITSKRTQPSDTSTEKEKALAETKKRLEKLRSERMALQEKLKRTAKCRMSITTPMADVTNCYNTPTRTDSGRCPSIVWADSTPTNSHSLEQATPEKLHSPGFATPPLSASILKKASAK